MFLDQSFVFSIGDDDNVFRRNDFAISFEGLLQKRLTDPEEIEELLRFTFAAIWPKTATDATGHNYTIVIVVSHDRLGFKVSAKLGFFFVFKCLFMINDVIITFFEEKTGKKFGGLKKSRTFAPAIEKQILVS